MTDDFDPVLTLARAAYDAFQSARAADRQLADALAYLDILDLTVEARGLPARRTRPLPRRRSRP